MRRRRRRTSPDASPETHGTPIVPSEEDALPVLQSGEIIGGHRVAWGSNYTFLVHVDAGNDKYLRAVYKPRDGERPLYDFPRGSLYKREYAAFVLSRALGWPNVPLTLLRDGPYGVGSMQLYIDADPDVTYFELIGERAEELRRFAVFDLLVNNADRKAGHCLLSDDGRIWSIDHGLTFHPAFKVRTVMLEFWGEPIPEPLLAELKAFQANLDPGNSLVAELGKVLTGQEVDALRARLGFILDDPVLPQLDPYRNVPWPWV